MREGTVAYIETFVTIPTDTTARDNNTHGATISARKNDNNVPRQFGIKRIIIYYKYSPRHLNLFVLA